MANDYIIKNGLILNKSNSINTIISGNTSLTYNEHALVSEYTIKTTLDNYLDSGTTLNELFDVNTNGVIDNYILSYSANTWIVNDINDIIDTTELPTISLSYTSTTPPSSFGPVVWNRTDIQNNIDVLELNSAVTSRINIKENGLFYITYQTNLLIDSTTDSYGRVAINGTTIISNSHSHINTYSNERHILICSFSTYLTAGTYVELQLDIGDQSNDNIENTSITITKLNAINSKSAKPSGIDMDIQFNKNGAFGGDDAFTFNSGTSTLKITNVEITNTLNMPSTGSSTYTINYIYDEDDMSSNSNIALATQQSIKAYIDNKVITGNTFNAYPTVSQSVSTSGIILNFSTIRAGSGVSSISSGVLTMLVSGEKTIIVTYSANISTTTRSSSRAKLQIDTGSGWVDVANAQCSLYHRTSTDGETTGTISVTLSLNINDKLRVFAWNVHGSDASTIPEGCSITLISTTGPKGDKGDTGNSGDIDWQHSWTSKNYTENQAVEYLGSSYVCILDTTSNQPPTNTTYWDLLASKGDAGAGSSVNIYNNGTSLGSFTDIDFSDNITAADVGSGVAKITISPEYMVPIWAEENAALANSTYEWAFGNGANTANDLGVTIYVPNGWSCQVVAMSLRIKSGTATVELVHNGVLQGSNCNVTISSGQGATNDSFTPITISNGDYINFRTTTASGTASSNIVTAWLKYYK